MTYELKREIISETTPFDLDISVIDAFGRRSVHRVKTALILRGK